MTDIENYVINTISNRVASLLPDLNVDVLGFYVDTPKSFPCVCVQMSDRETYTRSLDGCLKPHHETVYFSVDVYSNKAAEKKSEAKRIAAVVDDAMTDMLFTLVSQSPTPNIDRSVYRITSRYSAVHADGKASGDETVVQMYRK